MIDLDSTKKLLINLRHRKDRLEESKKECSKFFNTEFIVVEGIRNKETPLVGIAESHQKCIQIAKDENLDYVIIMEDDIMFTSIRARKYADLALTKMPAEWDILSGGFFEGSRKKFNEFWSKAEGFYGAHFLIVNKTAYDKILSFDKSCHIDAWMAKNLTCYCTNKMFTVQRDGMSDNSKKHRHWLGFIRKFDVLK